MGASVDLGKHRLYLASKRLEIDNRCTLRRGILRHYPHDLLFPPRPIQIGVPESQRSSAKPHPMRTFQTRRNRRRVELGRELIALCRADRLGSTERRSMWRLLWRSLMVAGVHSAESLRMARSQAAINSRNIRHRSTPTEPSEMSSTRTGRSCSTCPTLREERLRRFAMRSALPNHASRFA